MSKEICYSSNWVQLKKGEYERPDGKHEYSYSVFGKSFSFYANTLEELREKDILSEKNEIKVFFALIDTFKFFLLAVNLFLISIILYPFTALKTQI